MHSHGGNAVGLRSAVPCSAERLDRGTTLRRQKNPRGGTLLASGRKFLRVVTASGFAELPDDVGAITRLRKPYSQDDLAHALARSQNSGGGGPFWTWSSIKTAILQAAVGRNQIEAVFDL